MLFEAGPIALMLEGEIPPPAAARETSEAFVAGVHELLEAGAAALDDAGLELANAAAGVEDDGAALDVSEAAAELARQSGEVSPELVSAAAGAGVLEGDLAGLANELLGDLTEGEPPAASIPPEASPDLGEGSDGSTPGAPGAPVTYVEPPLARNLPACFGPECAARYREALGRQVLAWSGREATSDELQAVDRYMGTYGYLDDDALDWLWANWVQPNL